MTGPVLLRRMGALAVVLGVGAMVLAGETASTRVADLPRAEIIVQAHRGAGRHLPENTLESFEYTWKIGAIPEADIRETKDGVIVAFHDANFARLVKDIPADLRNKGIVDLTWEEVAQLDVGAWKGERYAGQRIPRIVQVFAAMKDQPGRCLYLDVKKVSLDKLASMAREHGVTRQLILASTKYDELRQWKKLLPEAQTLHWMGGEQQVLEKRLSDLRKAGFADITQLQIHVKRGEGTTGDLFTPSSEFLRNVARELRERRIVFQSLPLNSSDPDVYRKLLDVGVVSFATDDPEIVLGVMREHAARKKGD